MEEKTMRAQRQPVVVAGALMIASLLASCAQDQAPRVAQVAPAAGPTTVPSSDGLRSANVEYLTASASSPAGLPPNARSGECCARVVIPARYETVAEQVIRKPASSKIDTQPAEFEDVQERVVVKPASKRIEVVPATFDDVEERVMVRPASKRLEPVPATYRTVTEQVVVRPAYQVWKRSSELTPEERLRQNLPADAGDILCLVDVPAESRTVTREVIATPATTREVEIPAEFTTVRKRVVKTPATTREIVEPEEYGTVSVKRMVRPARETRTEIPAEYDTVSKQVLRSPATTEWRQILCETNATPEMLSRIQRALRQAGFDPGRDDGRIDAKTMAAVRAYQQARNLPVDADRYINIATVRALGINA
jgi:hypothetical protein